MFNCYTASRLAVRTWWRQSSKRLLSTEPECSKNAILNEVNGEFALPYFDLRECDTDANNITYKSSLFEMYKQDSIALPNFNLTEIVENVDVIQRNVDRRKCARLNVDKDIAQVHQRLQTIDDRLQEVKTQIRAKSGNLAELKETRTLVRFVQRKLTAMLYDNLMLLPNTSHQNAIAGGGVIEYIGKKPEFESSPLDHVAIGIKLGLFRQNRLHEFCGPRNYFLVGQGAELEQALISYTLDKLRSKGFMAVTVPNMIRSAAFDGSGISYQHLDKMIYQIGNTESRDGSGIEYRLAGTSEVGLCTYFANHAVRENLLPKKVCCVSTCYRKETDSRGEKTGLFRVHQFNKVEMFAVAGSHQQSNATLESFVDTQKEICSELGLHARVLEMPEPELGLPAHRKIDVEVWFPGRGDYGEVSSASDCTDFQSRRLQILSRDRENVYKYAHTINGTACATTRLIAALIENGQRHGSKTVRLPECLHPYMPGSDGVLSRQKFKMQYIGVKQSKSLQQRPK